MDFGRRSRTATPDPTIDDPTTPVPTTELIDPPTAPPTREENQADIAAAVKAAMEDANPKADQPDRNGNNCLIVALAIFAALTLISVVWIIKHPGKQTVNTSAAASQVTPAPTGNSDGKDANKKDDTSNTDNGGGLTASDGGMVDLLPDGRSVNPRQSATIVPSLSPDCPPYGDSGVNSTPRTFKCTIAKGAVVISGGVASTKYNVADGFLAAENNTTWNDTIIDGFYVIKPSANAEGEWCSRFDQAHLPANSWLGNHLKTVTGWKGCSVQLIEKAKADAAASSNNTGNGGPAASAPNNSARVETGPKQVKAFPAGALVEGSVVCENGKIVLDGDTPKQGAAGCTGTRTNEVSAPIRAAGAGEVWNGAYTP